MKNVIVSFLLLTLASIFSITTYAAEDRQPKSISGKVRNADLTVAKNVLVTISCKNTTLTDTTSVNGNYSVIFGNLQCEQFDTLFVSVITTTSSGSLSKVITYAQSAIMSDLILQNNPVVSVSPTGEVPVSVPEFGTLSAIMAGSVSVLTYLRLRRTLI